ncbi:hypothetical protein [uncultured Neglectibacter sp.]|uniref:hypothetical protein n=1 Tax=uncultured Neglectibacter sp. TaxID=1924108 RepID=UPI0034DE5C5A
MKRQEFSCFFFLRKAKKKEDLQSEKNFLQNPLTGRKRRAILGHKSEHQYTCEQE